MTICDLGASNLKAQILRQSIQDWHMSKREMARRAEGKGMMTRKKIWSDSNRCYVAPEYVLGEIEAFFRSQWFGVLFYDLDVDGEEVFRVMQDGAVAQRVSSLDKGNANKRRMEERKKHENHVG